MRIIVALAAYALLLAGCADVHSAMLSQNTAIVSARGASAGDHDKIIEGALAEAAKLTRAHGYQYFVVFKAEDASRTGIISLPGQTIDNEKSHARPLGTTNFGAPNLPGAAFTTPGRKLPYFKPGLDITIEMYRPGEIDPRLQGVWNADIAPGSFLSMPQQQPAPPPARRRRTASALRG